MQNLRNKNHLKRFLLIFLLTVSLTTPSSAFASGQTDFNSFDNEEKPQSFFSQIFRRLFADSSNDGQLYTANDYSDYGNKKDSEKDEDHTDRDHSSDEDNWEDKDHDWGGYDREEWEEWFRKNRPSEESDKIWERWYCDWGRDDDGDHDD